MNPSALHTEKLCKSFSSGGTQQHVIKNLDLEIREKEEINLLTQKFYCGKSNSAGKDCSGLGLYIASELMAKMGGELICSCRNEGFCVTLIIPLS